MRTYGVRVSAYTDLSGGGGSLFFFITGIRTLFTGHVYFMKFALAMLCIACMCVCIYTYIREEDCTAAGAAAALLFLLFALAPRVSTCLAV